jgi:arsenate reductase-like glutaredoxin family protein
MVPTVQIIGTKHCSDTRKADRFFRERGVRPHFVDLKERPLSRGELENISRHIDPEQLLDQDSKAYSSAGLAYMVYDPIAEAMKNPAILKTPIVRCGKAVTIGLQPEVWTGWLREQG